MSVLFRQWLEVVGGVLVELLRGLGFGDVPIMPQRTTFGEDMVAECVSPTILEGQQERSQVPLAARWENWAIGTNVGWGIFFVSPLTRGTS